MAAVMAAAPEPKSRGIDYSRFDNIEDSDDERPAASSKTAAKDAQPEKPHCQNCHKEIRKAFRCGACKKAEYCSADCQKDDWRFHKRNCKKPDEPKAQEPSKAPPGQPKPAEKKRTEEEKVVEDDEKLTWYRHREWKPTEEPKKEFTPVPLPAGEAARAEEAPTKPNAGSVWNAAGTWEEKDVTAVAQKTLQERLADFCPEIDAAGGSLSAEAVDAVTGDASKPVIRGTMRHLFDLSFKVKFAFKWMDSSGQRRVQGEIEVNDFTNDTFAEAVLSPPAIKLSFKDAAVLDAGRKQAVEEAIGAGAWPPSPSSLMGRLAARLEAWAKEYGEAA